MAFPNDGLSLTALAVSACRVASAFMRFYGDWFTRPNFLEGKVKLLPWPRLSTELSDRLDALVRRETERRRMGYRGHEPFFEFVRPFSLDGNGGNESISIDWATLLGHELETAVEKAYGLDDKAAAELHQELDEALAVRGVPPDADGEEGEEEDAEIILDCSERTGFEAIASHALGCAVGRWDVRYATGESPAPELLDPFAPLPTCSPGQLQNAQGLPVRPQDLPASYPIHIPWDGILVQDPGHPLDIESRVHEVMGAIWRERAEAIEQRACGILGVQSLRDYFSRFSSGKLKGFFEHHLDRYTKSKRKAPIYWPLSTTSGNYTLWIYYHRLTDQTLHTALADFVDPKIKTVERDIEVLRERAEGGGTQVGESQEFLDELKEFRAEIERIIKLPWKPNLNDGVLITACPLWKLFRLPKWRKDLEACWKELEGGDYDWAHLAYTIWPDRVKEKCKTDRSLAIAHSLEELCQVQPPEKRAKKNKTKHVEENPKLLED